jgi:hypothetical protein
MKTKIILLLLLSFSSLIKGQDFKPKSYLIYKQDYYDIAVKDNHISILLSSEEKKWVGDKNHFLVDRKKISYTNSFEEISDIIAYSISADNKKEPVNYIGTADVEIEDIFYHDLKYKYFYFPNLNEGSQTFLSYKKKFYKPQFLQSFFFKDDLDCKSSKITIRTSNDVEIGYVLQGKETEKIEFTSTKETNFTTYTWQLLNSEKEESEEFSPNVSYYSPHLIFYIKSYKNSSGVQKILGSIDDLYAFYYETTKNINKEDQSELKSKTKELTNGLTTDFEKTKAIFDFVQSKINYVAFENGMGGYIPREATDVLQKKYGDCKDMANLLSQMLQSANIEANIAWIGTRQNNYTYNNVPTPIADNHMITIAKINHDYFFLDATSQFTLFPDFTPFIQGKEALLKIDEKNYKIISIPIVPAEKNKTKGKIQFTITENNLIGKVSLELTGYVKSQFNKQYKTSIDKSEILKEYTTNYIQNINTSDIKIKNDDLSQNPLEIKYQFQLEKWTKLLDNQLIFKPILFFPYSNARIDLEKRKTPIENDFQKSFDFEYEIKIPEGYKVTFIPENFVHLDELFQTTINYKTIDNTILIIQKTEIKALLLEKNNFELWNNSIKNITKQYKQNIILTRK